MKKFVILSLTALCAALLCGCSKGDMKNVSERRSAFFTAEDEALTVTAVSGVREMPYTVDGVAGQLKPYTLITLIPKTFDVDAVYTYSAVTANGSYGGTFTVHPFAASFSAEFDAETSSGFSVTVTCCVQSKEYALSSLVTEDMLTFEKAIDVAQTELRPSGEYEIRARLIRNPLGEGLCWHVAYYSADGDMKGVLLDPVSAKVLAKKS